MVALIAAVASTLAFATAASAGTPSTSYRGWGSVAPSGGAAAATAWQWSTGTGWLQSRRFTGARVYLWPFASGWTWTWSADAGWLAMASRDLRVDADPSGEAMPRGDLPGWRQVFADDFTQDVALGRFPADVATRWKAYPSTWRDTSKNGQYNAERTVTVADGQLHVYLHTENGTHLVAALVPRLPEPITSGRYAIRFRAEPVHGYKTAWLLWPDSGVWPRDGEIDFPEGDLDGSRICAFMHRQWATTGSDQDAYCSNTTYQRWHTAVIEWRPNYARFILDGAVLGTSTTRVPQTPMHWVIQTETALNGIAPADSAAGYVDIDWVAAWLPS